MCVEANEGCKERLAIDASTYPVAQHVQQHAQHIQVGEAQGVEVGIQKWPLADKSQHLTSWKSTSAPRADSRLPLLLLLLLLLR